MVKTFYIILGGPLVPVVVITAAVIYRKCGERHTHIIQNINVCYNKISSAQIHDIMFIMCRGH